MLKAWISRKARMSSSLYEEGGGAGVRLPRIIGPVLLIFPVLLTLLPVRLFSGFDITLLFCCTIVGSD
jgi:hypothetical protein